MQAQLTPAGGAEGTSDSVTPLLPIQNEGREGDTQLAPKQPPKVRAESLNILQVNVTTLEGWGEATKSSILIGWLLSQDLAEVVLLQEHHLRDERARPTRSCPWICSRRRASRRCRRLGPAASPSSVSLRISLCLTPALFFSESIAITWMGKCKSQSQ